jgi:hypothetical protein
VEVAVMNNLAEGNRMLAGEITPIFNGVENENKREIVEKLKGDIVRSLVNERILKAMS